MITALVDPAGAWALAALLRLAGALAVVLTGAVAWHLLRSPLAHGLTRSRLDPAVVSLLLLIGQYLFLGTAVLVAAAQLGVQVGALLGTLGVFGLAVGLAAKDTVGNFISG